jgi:branched-chain amino acid transport system ATP-binding protein
MATSDMRDTDVNANNSQTPVCDLLALNKVSRSYGALRAVDNVTLMLRPGEICGLVGPNGSGKTTLLNLISGFVRPSKGRIRLLGKDVTTSPAHVVARMGIGRTFQLVRLLGHETVRENVSAGLYWEHRRRQRTAGPVRPFGAREIREKVHVVLERLDILGYADHHASELPFGIQRRVELARAIVGEPALLLLDEPAAGVSEQDLTELGKTMKEESERGCSVLLVEHHLRFVLDVCPRLIVLNYGQIIFDGIASEARNSAIVREAYMGT